MAKKEYIERPAGKNENDIIENPMILETSGKGKEKAGNNSEALKGPSANFRIEFGPEEQKKVADAGNCIGIKDDKGNVTYSIEKKETTRGE